MYNNESHLSSKNNTSVANTSKEERIKYACLLMGYHNSICSLSSLDYKSETIQVLIGLTYDLMRSLKQKRMSVDAEYSPKLFAKKHCRILLIKKSEFIESYGEDGFEFLVNSIKYFGKQH